MTTTFDVNPVGTEWEQTAHHICQLAAGEALADGPYTLWFNKDGEGYWHLHYEAADATAHYSILFDGVVLPGNDSFLFKKRGVYTFVLDGVPTVAPKLAGVLTAIAGGDPTRHFPPDPPETDNYYDVTGTVAGCA